jgi:hypothetical protein
MQASSTLAHAFDYFISNTFIILHPCTEKKNPSSTSITSSYGWNGTMVCVDDDTGSIASGYMFP